MNYYCKYIIITDTFSRIFVKKRVGRIFRVFRRNSLMGFAEEKLPNLKQKKKKTEQYRVNNEAAYIIKRSVGNGRK